MTAAEMKEIEASFRIWSFHQYYYRVYATEKDNVMRFAKSLLASIRPIRDKARLLEWARLRAEAKAVERFKDAERRKRNRMKAAQQSIGTILDVSA